MNIVIYSEFIRFVNKMRYVSVHSYSMFFSVLFSKLNKRYLQSDKFDWAHKITNNAYIKYYPLLSNRLFNYLILDFHRSIKYDKIEQQRLFMRQYQHERHDSPLKEECCNFERFKLGKTARRCWLSFFTTYHFDVRTNYTRVISAETSLLFGLSDVYKRKENKRNIPHC